jgi:hypothetical protein
MREGCRVGLKKVRCPKCKACAWRCPIYQSVNVEIDKDFNVIDNGCDFSDAEVEKEKLFCGECGYSPNEVEK